MGRPPITHQTNEELEFLLKNVPERNSFARSLYLPVIIAKVGPMLKSGREDFQKFFAGIFRESTPEDQALGRLKRKTAPSPGVPMAETQPPCASTRRFTIASPTPFPGKSADE